MSHQPAEQDESPSTPPQLSSHDSLRVPNNNSMSGVEIVTSSFKDAKRPGSGRQREKGGLFTEFDNSEKDLKRKASTSSSTGSSGPSPTPEPGKDPNVPKSPVDPSMKNRRSSMRRLRARSHSNASSSASGGNSVLEHSLTPVAPSLSAKERRSKSMGLSPASSAISLNQGDAGGGGDAAKSGNQPPVKSGQAPPQHHIEEISEAETRKMKALFVEFDKDNSGSIDVVELQDLLRTMGHAMSTTQAMDLLGQVDTNSNGFLEFDEFEQLVKIFKDTAQFRLYDDEKDVKAHITKATSDFSKILPDAHWMWARDVFMSLCILYCVVSATLFWMPRDQRSFQKYADALLIPDLLMTLPLGLEMVIRFNTSHQVGNKMTDSTWEIIRRYGSLWFWIDLLALLPLRLFTSDFTTAVVLAQFRLLGGLRLPQLFATSNQMALTRAYVNFHFVFVPAFMQLVYFIILVHVCAVVWFRLFEEARTYASCVYMTMYFFSSVGYGDQDLDTMNLRWFANINCVMSMGVNALVIGNIVTMLNQADVEGIRRGRLVETQAVLNFFDVPRSLQEEILQFQNHVLTRDVEKSFNYLIDHLPGEIKANLSLEIKLDLLNAVPFIQDAHKTVQIALSRRLEVAVFPPEWYVSVAGEVADEMYFINFGYVDVSTDMGIYVETLSREGTIAMNCLLMPPNSEYIHTDSAKTLTFVEMMLLSQESFREVLTGFPRFALQVDKAREVYERERLGAMLGHNSAGNNPQNCGSFELDPNGFALSPQRESPDPKNTHDPQESSLDTQAIVPFSPVQEEDSVGKNTSSESDLEDEEPQDKHHDEATGTGLPSRADRGVARTPPMRTLGRANSLDSGVLHATAATSGGLLAAPAEVLLLSPRTAAAAAARKHSERYGDGDATYGAMNIPSHMLHRGDVAELLEYSEDVISGLDELVREVLIKLNVTPEMSNRTSPRAGDDALAHVPSHEGYAAIPTPKCNNPALHSFEFGSSTGQRRMSGTVPTLTVEEPQPDVVIDPPDSPQHGGA